MQGRQRELSYEDISHYEKTAALEKNETCRVKPWSNRENKTAIY